MKIIADGIDGVEAPRVGYRRDFSANEQRSLFKPIQHRRSSRKAERRRTQFLRRLTAKHFGSAHAFTDWERQMERATRQ